MQLSVPHKFNQLQAITHVKKALNHARSQLAGQVSDMKEDWRGSVLHFAFTAQKQHISGTMEVRDHSFEIDAKLPLMLRIFEGRIKKQIEEQVKEVFG